ncbi:hypothetical protein BST47_29380 [Mycolicibacterium tusciae]|uniref:Uncharacterized protein n=1 Tax=Mycolicibacterium tusciae TaxID=75922 RepID=A0A1X0JEY0_9MYCO|nr:hypothetical protein BST47_29380 [Mycolicibacterium tusciae]
MRANMLPGSDESRKYHSSGAEPAPARVSHTCVLVPAAANDDHVAVETMAECSATAKRRGLDRGPTDQE